MESVFGLRSSTPKASRVLAFFVPAEMACVANTTSKQGVHAVEGGMPRPYTQAEKQRWLSEFYVKTRVIHNL